MARRVTVREVVQGLDLRVLAGAAGLDREIRGGYASDMLSCVMAAARPGDVWVTLQVHHNVVAVASLKELACVIITEGARVAEDILERAESEGVILLGTEEDTYCTVGRLVRMGIWRE